MSEGPLVLTLAFHAPILPFFAIGPTSPIPNIVGCTPEGGVARTVSAYTATPRPKTRRAHAHFDLISPPLGQACLRQRDDRQLGPARPTLRNLRPRGPRSYCPSRRASSVRERTPS